MTSTQFPPIWYTKPYSWRQGYITGKWQLTEKDKTPPEPNPCTPGTQPWSDWEEGFAAGKQSIQQKGK